MTLRSGAGFKRGNQTHAFAFLLWGKEFLGEALARKSGRLEPLGEHQAMRYLGRLMFATIAIFLIGSGIWANLGKAPLSEMRGVWVTQAMRGMIY